MIDIVTLGLGDEAVLDQVAEDVFDHAVVPTLVAEFLADPRHHIAVAVDDGTVVGMASAVHYIHPDKAAELWINEVGVSAAYRKQGLAKRLLGALLGLGRALGCREAWVLTDRSNEAARRLYESAGGTLAGGDTLMIEFRLADEPVDPD